MKTESCPDLDKLGRLLLGKLPDAEREGLDEHLLHCDDCAVRAETISASDELTAALQAPLTLRGDEEVLARVIEQACELCSRAETIETDETIVVARQNNDVASQQDSDGESPSRDATVEFLHPPEQHDEIGRLGGYRVLGVLGQGGMGVVFRAEDSLLKRQIALKAMKPAVACSQSAKERFLREAQATAAIEHDHIVHIYQVGEDQNVPFIAMQFLRGESLQRRLERDGRLDQSEILRIGQEVADGLTAAHKRKLIHRDVKPDNIWLEEETGRVKILDFGLVRTSTNDEGLTQSGAVLGTPRYMAPEQVMGQEVDHRCDLFSLGSLLYHLASGQSPFDGPNVTATLIAVAQKEPVPIEQLCPDLDSGLAELIMSLLSKDPNGRPQSAKQVSKALVELQDRLKMQSGQQRQVAEDDGAAAPRTGSSKSNMRLLFGGGAVAVAIAVIFCFWAAGFLFKVETQDGTLIVKVTGDEFAASVQGQKVVIKRTDSEDEYTIYLDSREKSQKLQPGDYFVLETESGLRTATNRFTIRSGEEELVEVSWEPKEQVAGSADGEWPDWPSDAPEPAIAPFDAEQAKRHQQEWAEYLGVSVERTINLPRGEKLTMVLIPPGEFLMGSSAEDRSKFLKSARAINDTWEPQRIPDEGPQQAVRIKRPFYLGKCEITQAQWQAVTSYNPSHYNGNPANPVEQVSWYDIQPFLGKLNEAAGVGGLSFALPSEAQWEYSCRAGTTSRWHCGHSESELRAFGWFQGNSGLKPHPVGQLSPNAFGLFDLHGNVAEWCDDRFMGAYGAKALTEDAGDPGVSRRMLRGGSCHARSGHCRAAVRDSLAPDYRCSSLGFRVAASIDSLPSEDASDSLPPMPADSAVSYAWPSDAPEPASAPFNAEQAKRHQQEWAEYLGVPVEQVIDLPHSEELILVLIPPGEFLMGSTGEAQRHFVEESGGNAFMATKILSESPQHQVRITRPFYLGKHEVTQAQWQSITSSNPSYFRNKPTHPVERVTWEDIQHFLVRLDDSVSTENMTFALPTEAQWEFACRAGTTTIWQTGDSEAALQDHGWSLANSDLTTHPVGQLRPNAFGLHDMHGNVWEWCSDWFAFTYARSPVDDPIGVASGLFRVHRGGGYDCDAARCRSAFRGYRQPASTAPGLHTVGFRVAASIALPRKAVQPKTALSSATAKAEAYKWPDNAPSPAVAPFDAHEATKHQQAWADYLGLPMVYENSLGMKLVLIPPGEFAMGSMPAEVDEALKAESDRIWHEVIVSEAPQRRVILTHPVYLGVHEVTQAQYEKITGHNPSRFAPKGLHKDTVVGVDTSDHPVEMVSWEDAASFCVRLTEREGLKSLQPDARGDETERSDEIGYRLPTEAEWEFACRAGTTTRYWIGEKDQDLPQTAWFVVNSDTHTHAVGQLKANPFGLFDTHGNVFEWVQDWWDPMYSWRSRESLLINPSGPSFACSHRVVRGGDWNAQATRCRASSRPKYTPTQGYDYIGFRVALVVGDRTARKSAENSERFPLQD